MISQADIIKTLVNKNCTDDSVMTTALSPNFMPAKLLEKLTEAERFDLALDISMKLGLDVSPLCKTWAMRCLRARNFSMAREKFRNCFKRFRLPGNRMGSTQSKLLMDILNELKRMKEKQAPLVDEVQNIKQGNCFKKIDSDTSEFLASSMETPTSISCRPTILAECQYYLNEYGDFVDKTRFNLDNHLWDQAVENLLNGSDRINLDKFFLGEVYPYVCSTGHLRHFIEAFPRIDPDLSRSTKYLKAIYDTCLRYRRYNTLHFVQSTIGDLASAADTQLRFFFLSEPVRSYRELNHRLSHLEIALNDYYSYLKLNRLEDVEDVDNSNLVNSGDGSKKSIKLPTFFTKLEISEVEEQISLLKLQIDITSNFALNEVSGTLISDLDIETTMQQAKPNQGSSLPVTIFDKSQTRRTFLAALVLVYYDVSCTRYLSKDGLDLANRLIKDYCLDKLEVFKTAMRIIVEDEGCDIMENAKLLLDCLKSEILSELNIDNGLSSSVTMQVGQRSKLSTEVIKTTPSEKRRADGEGYGENLSSQRSNVYLERMSKLSEHRTQPPPSTSSPLLSPNKRLEVKNLSTKGNRKTPSFTGKISLTQRNTDYERAPNEMKQKEKQQLHETNPDDIARIMCDDVIRDSIANCREPDYEMELAKLLSAEAKIELYIEHGKLNNAQMLACTMNRPDYVSSIIKEADKLNQDHVKTVCQLWLAKHETKNSIR